MTISILLEPPREDVRGMTFPAVASILGRIGADSSVFAAGWHVGGSLVGLAVCRITAGSADLVSLFVSKAYRNQGGGRELLAAVESEARRRGSIRMTAAYSTAVPGCAPLEAVFRNRNWEQPTPRMEMFFTTRRQLAELMAQPIYRRYRRPELPRGCRLVPWNGLTPEMRAEIISSGDALDDAPVEPLASYGIVSDKGLLCGLLSHRISPDMIRYCRAHVAEIAQSRRGILIQLFAHAFWRHADAGPDRGCFAVFHDNHSLLAVIDRRMTSRGAISTTAQSRIIGTSLM